MSVRRSVGLTLDQADHIVENVVGVIGIPVGVATNFVVNGREVLVPMATEEPSVVAAPSNLARTTRDHGAFVTSSTPPLPRDRQELPGGFPVTWRVGSRACMSKVAARLNCCPVV